MNKIFNNSESYSIVENEIINRINDNPKEFVELDLVSYSKKINCSKSAIQRLVKLLNFESLFSMKQYVNESIIFNDLFFNIKDNITTKDRVNNIKSYNNFAINETIMNLDIKNLSKIISKICKAKQILVFGIGSSYLAATEFSNNMLKLGFSISASNDIHNSLLILSNFSKTDLLILFTKSGVAKEIQFFKKNKQEFLFDILVVTANENYAKEFKYKIIHKDMEKKERIIATSSKICQLIISDIIFYEIFYQKNDKRIIENNKQFINKWNNKK
ncbi:MurR/RpiR family transcriptional regulator [Mesomycoplasma moatsii]|uniref:MurR/RpiR family transcriptional regulator n=1 Tax=Mesomycoplasma moatsii TaxID=171287 RepID=UPI0003B63CDD